MPVGMELHELHVLQGQAGAQHHGIAVAGAGVRRCTGEIGTAITAGREDHLVRPEAVQLARSSKFDRNNPAARAVLHDQVERRNIR